MISTDKKHHSYPLIKQSQVRKLSTYASSTSSNASGSSANNSPSGSKQKLYHHLGDNDEGYASFTTTTSTLLGSNVSSTLQRDDSAYYTSGSERLSTRRAPSSASSSRILVESDSDISEDDDELEDLIDWPSLNQQVQALVSRFDKWLHHPLPERCVPVKKSFVEHAYPVLQRRTSSIPLSINLVAENARDLPDRSNYAVNFVQNRQQSKRKPSGSFTNPRPHVHFPHATEQLQHCGTCSRLLRLTSSTTTQRSPVTCPYCEQIYCSKACQASDWPSHKRQCPLADSYACCGRILHSMKSNMCILQRLSTLASSGYLTSGRGATLLYFDNATEADRYVQSGTIENSRLMAVYWALKDGQKNRAIDNLRPMEYKRLHDVCMNYDPSQEFVCHVTIRVEGNHNGSSNTYVSQTIVYRLLNNRSDSPRETHTRHSNPTLYLTSLNYDPAVDDRHHMRQVFFAKLQVELRERGIEIEQHYPELYDKLCHYINGNAADEEPMLPFTPLCLFMRHRHSQQLFMCVITPESEPDRSWLLDRGLIEQQLTSGDQ